MQKALKRSFIILVALVTMLFTCVLMPKQKAEASLLVIGGVALGTAVAIGLICYGIGVSSDDPAEDEYLDMACDKLVDVAAGQGISKWDLMNNYILNSGWFFAAMAEVASWFYEMDLVMNETYETSFPVESMLDGAVNHFTVSYDAPIVSSVSSGDAVYQFEAEHIGNQSIPRDCYFFLDSIGDLYLVSNNAARATTTIQYQSSSFSKGIYVLTGSSPSVLYNTRYYENLTQRMSDDGFPISATDFFVKFGITFATTAAEGYTVENFIDSLVIGTVEPTSPGISVDFPERLFTAPSDVIDITGKMESYKIDATKDVINPADALELTELKTFDGLRDRLLEGDITAEDVITSVGAQPYVLTDGETGEIATSDTPLENVKPVALTGDLSIPQDLVAEDTYTPTNTDTDSDSKSKNRFNFPLSQFFPFCLPFDIYDFLTFFAADPVAPVIEIPIGEFFADVPGVTEDTTGYVMRLDLGEENFSKWFEILRLLESLGIIVGLIMVSRKLIHGGN